MMDNIPFIGLVIGGIGYAIGQFFVSRKKGASDALSIALQEVEAIKVRVDRLEMEKDELRREVAALRTENETLRSVIVNRNDLDEKLLARLEDALQKQTKRLVDVLREGRE